MSPWLVLPAGLILFGALPIGSGYWLADRERRLKVIHLGTVAGIAIAFACLPHAARWLGVPVAIIALEAMLMIPRTKAVTDGALAALRTRRTRTLAILLQASAGLLALSAADTLAGSLYRSAAGGAFWGRIAAVIGAAAGVLAAYGDRVAAVLKPVAGRIRLSVPRSLLFATAGIGLAACLLVGVGIFSHALSAGLDVPSDRPVPVDASGTPSTASREHRDLIWTTGSLAACMFLSWLASLSTPFLNRSSHHAFYAARLTRSYLGASNPRRHGRGLALREYDADDDTELEAYYDTAGFQGAPVHLVNLTINETVDGASNVQQRDRRGLILSIGPDGARVGRDRAVDIDWKQGAVLVDSGPRTGNQLAGGARPEALTLGQWTALSGAAFSTGLGSRTHLGTSLLCGIGNIRLGYWWSPGFPPGVSVGEVFEAGWRRIRAIGSAVASTVSFVVRRVTSGVSGLRALGTPSKPPVRPPSEPLAVIPGLRRGPRILTRLREIFGVHAYILSEFVARFPGTSWPRWYLSDGGHFENLGGYELVRRRLPRILLVDAEADPTYVFEGLSNLVRKARMDFGAEIRFLNEHELDAEVAPDVRPFFGSLSALRRRPSKAPDRTGGLRRTSVARAALAEVTYDDRSRGRLLYVKATVTGDEPIDVVAYAMAHASFPHESTLDQSFDEAQWESYRRLGEHVGSLLFADGGHTGTHGFHPRTFFRGAATAPTPPTSPDRRATPGTKSA